MNRSGTGTSVLLDLTKGGFLIVSNSILLFFFAFGVVFAAEPDRQRCRPGEPAPWVKEELEWNLNIQSILPFEPYSGEGETKSHAAQKSKWDRQRRDTRELLWHTGHKKTAFGDGYFGLTLYSSLYPSNDPTVTHAPLEVLWCILRPGDTILLSDGVTHHYTNIFSVDRVANTLKIIDHFPHNIFLKKGLNVADVEAVELRQKDVVLIQITKDELFRILHSISTASDLPFVDNYFEIYPSARQDELAYLAIALSILSNRIPYPFDSDPLRMQRTSDYLRRAMDLARKHRADAVLRVAAGKLHNALQVQTALLLIDKAALESRTDKGHITDLQMTAGNLSRTAAEIADLVGQYGEAKLHAEYEAEDFFRLGWLFSQIPEKYQLADEMLGHALVRAPDYNEVYLFRSSVRRSKGYSSAALEDVQTGLNLIEKEETESRSQIEQYMARSVESDQSEKVRLTLMRLRRFLFTRTAYAIHQALGDMKSLQADKVMFKTIEETLVDRYNADLLVADQAFKEGDIYTAYRHWVALADKKGIERRLAERNLGNLYAAGPGIVAISSDNIEGFMARMGKFERYQPFAETFKKDMVEAEKWWSRAAARGDAVASFNLGAMYANGDHYEKNLTLAYLWLSVAHALGHDKAAAALQAVSNEMTPGQLNEVRTLMQVDHVESGSSPAVVKVLVVLKSLRSLNIGPPSTIH